MPGKRSFMPSYIQYVNKGLVQGRSNTSQYEPNWDDLRFPAQGINPPGQVSDPEVETDTGMLLFSSSSDNLIAGIAQMPHAWKLESTISPHIHWEKTTSASGNVAWRFEYKWYNVGDTAPGSYVDLGLAVAPNSNIDHNDTADRHSLYAWDDISGTDKTLSSVILWRIIRDVSEDNYGADARLLEFDIHYQIDTLGSELEFIK